MLRKEEERREGEKDCRLQNRHKKKQQTKYLQILITYQTSANQDLDQLDN